MRNSNTAFKSIFASLLLAPLAACSEEPEKTETVVEEVPVETGSEIDAVAENAMEAAEKKADEQAAVDATTAETGEKATQ